MYARHQRRLTACLATMLGVLWLPAVAMGADAHQAVKAKPGDIVLLRNVSARPAYRPAPPGMALMVDPSPQHELALALGTQELSDADYASIGAGAPPAIHRGTTVERVVGSALGGTLVGRGGSASSTVAAGNGISRVISAPLGAVGNTTRGVGNQVLGALSQLPGMTPSASAGH